MLIPGQASDELDERGRPNRGATLLLLLNAGDRPRYFQLPALLEPGRWRERVNTAREPRAVGVPGVRLSSHSLLLLEREEPR
jgi:glycogen operon protein